MNSSRQDNTPFRALFSLESTSTMLPCAMAIIRADHSSNIGRKRLCSVSAPRISRRREDQRRAGLCANWNRRLLTEEALSEKRGPKRLKGRGQMAGGMTA